MEMVALVEKLYYKYRSCLGEIFFSHLLLHHIKSISKTGFELNENTKSLWSEKCDIFLFSRAGFH